MGRALQPARDVDDLTRQLDRIWHDIPQEDIRSVCLRVYVKRVCECLKALIYSNSIAPEHLMHLKCFKSKSA